MNSKKLNIFRGLLITLITSTTITGIKDLLDTDSVVVTFTLK